MNTKHKNLTDLTEATILATGSPRKIATVLAIAALACVSVSAQTESGSPSTKTKKRSVSVQTTKESLSAQAKKGSVKTGQDRGRYRVTLLGFTCHNQTWDHTLQVDGKDDEVYVVGNVRVVNRAGAVIQAPGTSRSETMGDTNGYPQRMRAGSASDKGGIKSGDSFPVTTPWRRRGGLNNDRPPMILWEGDLIAGETVATIIPTIWEWDGGDDIFTGWRRTIAANGAAIAGTALTLVSGPAVGAGTATALQIALPALSNFLGEVIGNASDRPIGLEKNGGGWIFNPQIITLTYEIAENTISNDLGKGRGVVPVEYQDASELRGKYTLYLQVERLSGGSSSSQTPP